MSKRTKRFVRRAIRSFKKILVVILCLCMIVLPELYVNDVVGLLDLLFLSVSTGVIISKLHNSVYPKKRVVRPTNAKNR